MRLFEERQVPRSVREVLSAPGQPLVDPVRRHFEARLGHDLGAVRVHDDARAGSSARDVQALAYTVGNHVVLGSDAPCTSELIGHELAHVVQQGGSPPDIATLRLGPVDSSAESEARDFARSPPAQSSVIQRNVTGELQREVSFELRDTPNIEVETSKQWSEDELRVLKWLRQHRDEIVSAEQRWHIDRRAIAAPIAWEALENVRSWSRRSAGPGKVHYRDWLTEGNTIPREVEQAGYLPQRTMDERRAALSTPAGAIEYIAAIMRAIADAAVEHGYNLQRSPVILTNVYHGSGLEQWKEHLKKKGGGEPLRAGNAMAIWTAAHLDYLEDCVGPTAIPIVDASKVTQSTQVTALLMRAPQTPVERARWILDAAADGFVTFNMAKHRTKLEQFADGKSVDGIDPTKPGALPVLATEVGLVRRLIERWLATSEEKRALFEHGSMTRPGTAHGIGKALDINRLKTDASVIGVERLLRELDPTVHGSYGLGMPYQSGFFDPADDLKAKRAAAEAGASSELDSLTVTGALQRWQAPTYRSRATRSAEGWIWSAPEVETSQGAEKLLLSASLKTTLAEARGRGLKLIVFPDEDGHLHIELK